MVLHRLGRTLAVDCDPQGSLMSWSEAAAEQGNPLPFTVVSLATRDVHVRLADLGAGYEHVIVDAPPGDLGIIRSAILASAIVLVPVSPTGLDLNRISPTFEILAEIGVSHTLGPPGAGDPGRARLSGDGYRDPACRALRRGVRLGAVHSRRVLGTARGTQKSGTQKMSPPGT